MYYIPTSHTNVATHKNALIGEVKIRSMAVVLQVQVVHRLVVISSVPY
jgi:hypothetical protein